MLLKPSIFHVPTHAGKRDYLRTGLNPDFVARHGTHLFFGGLAALVAVGLLLGATLRLTGKLP